jgi:hypothetical protein
MKYGLEREREREKENATMKWRMNSDEVYMARLKIGRKKNAM